ncbi:hypothetical protein EHE19_014215 [Ruminiclostridium herbifermentans]|uniref:ABC-2 family transporter protein n=1 Tax=Ruminiclostridium herbifermentans TaxID=2488810 RepID=A0A4U7JLH4_9FIRM|nr:hypothetical protein [Ruminiclostridium herbifermentans]QNU66028.1 hypothetical protein EHE19_014215 [Ruminiclostridium herbifermentans]
MRILKYEFYKLLSKKLLLLFILILFAINCYLYIAEQNKNDFQIPNEYENMLQQYSNLSEKEALALISESYDELNILSIINNLRTSNIAEEAIKDQVSPILKLSAIEISYDQLLEKYDNSRFMEDNSYLQDYITSLGLINNQLEYIESYPDFINSMEEKAEDMQSVSIFSQEGTFAYRNILKTPNDFRHLKDIKLKLGDETGIISATQYRFTDLSMAAIIFLMCVFIFIIEKESGLIRLTKSTKNGHVPVIVSKITVLVVTTAVLSLLFYGSILFLGNKLYGFGDLSRYIQSMSSFRDCSFLLSVKEFICLFIVTKIFVTVITAFIFAVIFNAFLFPKVIYLVLALFTGFSYICYTLIHPASYINTLKYINLFSFYDVFTFYGEYTNINFFGYPISKVFASIFVSLVVSVLTIALTIFSYVRNYSCATPILHKLINKIIIRRKRINGSTSMLIHETYKIFVTNKVGLIVVAALIIGYQNIHVAPFLMTKDTAVYKGYVDSLAGELTAQKQKFIQDEQKQFDNIPLELQKLKNSFEKDELDKAEYTRELNKITLFSEKKTGFERLKNQYQYLVNLKEEKKINGSFICELSSRYIFNNRTRDLYNGLIYCILLILCLSNIFPMEYKNGMVRVYKSTYNGRLRLFAQKGFIGSIIAIILMIIVYLPYYINLLSRYDIKSWSAPIQSIYLFENLDLNISVLGFVVLANFLQLIGCIAIAKLIILISLIVKKHSICILASTVILGFPIIISLMGITSLDSYSFNTIFVLFSSFSKSKDIISIISYYVFLVIILISSVLLGSKIYGGNLFKNIFGLKEVK